MTIAAEASLLTRAGAALGHACKEAGLDSHGCHAAAQLRQRRLPPGAPSGAVVRLAQATTPGKLDRLTTSVRVTRWLVEQGFPTIRPLDMKQPVVAEGFLATFWRHEEHIGPPPDPRSWGRCCGVCTTCRRCRSSCRPTTRSAAVRRAIDASLSIDDDDRRWLLERCDDVAEAYYERTGVRPAVRADPCGRPPRKHDPHS